MTSLFSKVASHSACHFILAYKNILKDINKNTKLMNVADVNNISITMFRGSRLDLYCKKGVLENLAKFTGTANSSGLQLY